MLRAPRAPESRGRLERRGLPELQASRALLVSRGPQGRPEHRARQVQLVRRAFRGIQVSKVQLGRLVSKVRPVRLVHKAVKVTLVFRAQPGLLALRELPGRPVQPELRGQRAQLEHLPSRGFPTRFLRQRPTPIRGQASCVCPTRRRTHQQSFVQTCWTIWGETGQQLLTPLMTPPAQRRASSDSSPKPTPASGSRSQFLRLPRRAVTEISQLPISDRVRLLRSRTPILFASSSTEWAIWEPRGRRGPRAQLVQPARRARLGRQERKEPQVQREHRAPQGQLEFRGLLDQPVSRELLAQPAHRELPAQRGRRETRAQQVPWREMPSATRSRLQPRTPIRVMESFVSTMRRTHRSRRSISTY